MAGIGKVALLALVSISAWTLCTARSHGTDLDKVPKSGSLKRLYSSDGDTRWLAHPKLHTSTNSAETSQTPVIDPPKDTHDATYFLITEPFSDTAISEGFVNIQSRKKPLLDFVKDRSYFINSKNVEAKSDLDKEKDMFLTISNSEKVISDHLASGLSPPVAEAVIDDSKITSKTGVVTPGTDRVTGLHTELIPEGLTFPINRTSSETENIKYVHMKKLNKNYNSDLDEVMSSLIKHLMYLETDMVNKREKRNTQHEHLYQETNETVTDNKPVKEHNLEHFDDEIVAGHKLPTSVDFNNDTEISDNDNVTNGIDAKSNDENSKLNYNDFDYSSADGGNKDVDTTHDAIQAADTSFSSSQGNNITTDAAPVHTTFGQSQEAVTHSATSTDNSDAYDTLPTAKDAAGNTSPVVQSLPESVLSNTTPFPLSMNIVENAFITNVADGSLSSGAVNVHLKYPENKDYSEITTAGFVKNDLYTETLGPQTSSLIIESDIATSNDADHISLGAKVSVSTPFITDTTNVYATDDNVIDIQAIHTTDVHATDAHTVDVHTTDVHTKDKQTVDAQTMNAHTITDAHTTNAHAVDVHTTDIHTTDVYTKDEQTTDAHTMNIHTTYTHTINLHKTGVQTTAAEITDVHTTDVYTTYIHTTNVDFTTLNTQTGHYPFSSEFSPGPNLTPPSTDSVDINSFTTSLVNFSSGRTVPERDHEIASTNADDSHMYPDNDSIAATKSKDSNFPLSEARLDWELAKQTWQHAWEIHIYTFGSLFGLVGLYTTMSFIRLCWINCLFPRGYFVSVHILVVFLCCTRAFYLLYDGYGSSGTFHAGLNHFFYSVSFPCMTSAFGLLFYSLLKATQVQLVSPSIQKIQVLVFLIVVHFLISMTADALTGFYTDMQVVQFVSHVYFITWGLFLFIGYVCLFPKLRRSIVKRQNDGIYTSPCLYSTNGKMKISLTLSAAIKAMFCAGVFGIIVVGMEVYAIVQVYKTFTGDHPELWTWWLYHTVLRTVELVVYLTLSYAVSLPLRYRRSEYKWSCGVLCEPCSVICCCSSSDSIAGFNHCEQVANSSYNDNGDNLTESSSKKLLYNHHLTDIIPTFDIQPTFGSRPNSLLIVEDGYVRFQTDYDINRIVDSCNDLSQRPTDVHNVSTFLRRDGCVNTGYSLHSREDTRNNNNLETNLTDKSRNNSITNSDFFRVPSSVSLADSMENELSKAFESFKMDESKNDHKADISTNLAETSNFRNTQETDLVSVYTNPESGTNSSVTTDKQSQSNYLPDEAQRDDSDLQLATLPRTAKSPEVINTLKNRDFSSGSNMQQKHRHCSIDGDRTFSVSRESPSSGYYCLLGNDETEIQILNLEDGDRDNEIEFQLPVRRPSEGQGSQAAVLTSLLKSWESGSNENIDV